MMRMQERKDLQISKVMSDDARDKSMKVRYLMQLFGPVEEDDDGNAFIYTAGSNNKAPARVLHRGEEEDARMGDSQ